MVNEEKKPKWMSGEIFQNDEYANIFAKHRNHIVTKLLGNTCFLMKKPLVGFIKAKVYFYKGDANELVAECYRLSKEKNIPFIEINTSIVDEAFSQFPNKTAGTYLIDLREDIETLWKKLDRSARSKIKQGEKNNVKIEISDKEKDFLEWWDIYKNTVVRKNFISDTFNLYKELFENKKFVKLFIAKIDDKIVSGNFIQISETEVLWKLGGSNYEFSKYRPNDLLQWKLIEWAKNQGYSYYDMGGAFPPRYDNNGAIIDEGHGEGPSTFKKKFGGEFKEINNYQIIADKVKYEIVNALINARTGLKKHL